MKRLLAMIGTLALVVGGCGSPSGVEAKDAWSRPVPPVSPASAIFLELHNGTDRAITLTGAETNACDEVQIHQTGIDEAGVMSMRPLIGGLQVAPGTTQELAPGGVHLMCMAPNTELDRFDVTLRIRDAQDIVIAVAVEDR